MCLTGMHGGPWGRFIKLKYMTHACNARSEAEMAAHAHLSNHAWQCMGNTWISPSPQIDLGMTQVRGDILSYQGTSEVQEEVVNSM